MYFIRPPASQVIQQRRDRTGKENEDRAQNRSERPIEPGDAHHRGRLLFNQGQRGYQAIFWRKRLEGFSDPLAGLAADCGIRSRWAGQVFWEFGFAARMPEMVKGGIGGDPSRPSAKVAGRLKPRSGPVNAPECFHRKILCNSVVTDDADDPRVDFLLVQPKQRLEGFQVARREPFQQFHLPLSIPNYWFLALIVTVFLVPAFGVRRRKFKRRRHKELQKEKAPRFRAPGPIGFQLNRRLDVVRLAGLQTRNLHRRQTNKPTKTVQRPVYMPNSSPNTGATTVSALVAERWRIAEKPTKLAGGAAHRRPLSRGCFCFWP